MEDNWSATGHPVHPSVPPDRVGLGSRAGSPFRTGPARPAPPECSRVSCTGRNGDGTGGRTTSRNHHSCDVQCSELRTRDCCAHRIVLYFRYVEQCVRAHCQHRLASNPRTRHRHWHRNPSHTVLMSSSSSSAYHSSRGASAYSPDRTEPKRPEAARSEAVRTNAMRCGAVRKSIQLS